MNNVNLIGRLVKDVELRSTGSGKQVANFMLAVNRPFGNDEADFLKIVAWNKTAEVCEKYLSKGSQVGITGRIQTGKYEDKDGKMIYTTDIVANEVIFIGSKKDKEQEKPVKEPEKDNEPDLDEFQSIDDDEDIPF